MDIQKDNQNKNEEKEINERDIDILEEFIYPYYISFYTNTDRILDLIALYIKLKKTSEFQSDHSLDDILRISIVFTHATLEDFLRTLASKLLPFSGSEALNQIPLAGFSPSGRAEKFLLGNLVKFKGKTIDEVIQESVNGSLQNSNFNNTKEISQLLKSLNIDITKVNETFPEIDELMKRRHIIVHRADKLKEGNSNEDCYKDVDSKEVLSWLQAVQKLIDNILIDIARQQNASPQLIKDIFTHLKR